MRGERRLGRSVAGERGEDNAVGEADRAGPSSERKRREERIRGGHIEPTEVELQNRNERRKEEEGDRKRGVKCKVTHSPSRRE